ncbi:hypothetical protein [Variovorax sp. dw_954]|uniref:hypothetical protein n=1 Tax=Variovorax sp. dw_954 TaxID=2720078 RepID=UPI001BD4FE43|nr:hypothetical protein [Variovorax sp. dw_954]
MTKLFTVSSRSFWRVPAAAVAALALAGGASVALGQSISMPTQAPGQGAAVTLLLRGPTGDPATLAFSTDAGWRLNRGWDGGVQAAQGGGKAQPMKTAFKSVALSADDQPAVARPLTVFIDGPTGYTFMYTFDQGWKFVGQIANGSR